jgi:hypothetical protein
MAVRQTPNATQIKAVPSGQTKYGNHTT